MMQRAPAFGAWQGIPGVDHTIFAVDKREPYQRDLGRIIHSASFRRLQAKTQVLGTGEGDFHRTRLTHTLEVGSLGRGLVWAFEKNCPEKFRPFLPSSELIEAVCYAHDLGHPPFGHDGERALHRKMAQWGGFEGNAQTIRVLTRLEKYYRGQGIRPTRRLLLGVLKYPVAYNDFEIEKYLREPPKCYYASEAGVIESALSVFDQGDIERFRSRSGTGRAQYKTFDCSIMEIADDIAYGIHDLEDGVARGLLRKDETHDEFVSIFREADIRAIREFSVEQIVDKLFNRDSCERKHAISLLVSLFMVSAEVSKLNLFASEYLDIQAVLPNNLQHLLRSLKDGLVYKYIIKRREVQGLEYKGEQIVSALFDALAERPRDLIGDSGLDFPDSDVSRLIKSAEADGWQKALFCSDRDRVARAIADFIAGMTNPYAEKFHRRLFEPGFGSSTDDL